MNENENNYTLEELNQYTDDFKNYLLGFCKKFNKYISVNFSPIVTSNILTDEVITIDIESEIKIREL